MNERKTICIIGSGQLGSRHLQALKNVRYPLNIYVFDVSEDSLKTAKERYESINKDKKEINTVDYLKISDIGKIRSKDVDLAIIATNSNTRAEAVKLLAKNTKTRYLIMEKLLFNKKSDYQTIAEILEKDKIKTWVNCSMRMMNHYYEIKGDLSEGNINYTVTGSNYGLITNSIHYIDHLSFLCGSTDLKVNTDYLDINIIDSKRKGFLELNGTLMVNFGNNIGSFTCYKTGTLPVLIEIFNKDARLISREWEGKAYLSKASDNWNLMEKDARIPYQSEMTKFLTESIIETGSCNLVTFSESSKIHSVLLESLNLFLAEKCKMKLDYYPFT